MGGHVDLPDGNCCWVSSVYFTDNRIPERINNYNCDGSLYTWNQRLVVPERGHGRIPQAGEDPEDSEADEWDRRYDLTRTSRHTLFEKHYSVNDVKFNNSG